MIRALFYETIGVLNWTTIFERIKKMTKIKSAAYEKLDRLDAAAAAAGANFLLANQSGDDVKMTLTQVATFMATNITTLTVTTLSATTGNITTVNSTTVSANTVNIASGITINSLSNTGSAMTFTAVATPDGAIGAITSGDGNCFGAGTAGEFEYLISEVKRHREILSQMIN